MAHLGWGYAHLWQHSGRELILCSFSPFVQFNNESEVGGVGIFYLPPRNPIFVYRDAGTA